VVFSNGFGRLQWFRAVLKTCEAACEAVNAASLHHLGSSCSATVLGCSGGVRRSMSSDRQGSSAAWWRGVRVGWRASWRMPIANRFRFERARALAGGNVQDARARGNACRASGFERMRNTLGQHVWSTVQCTHMHIGRHIWQFLVCHFVWLCVPSGRWVRTRLLTVSTSSQGCETRSGSPQGRASPRHTWHCDILRRSVCA
jgi:hypothetical protein